VFDYDTREHEYLGDWSFLNGGDIFRNPIGALTPSAKLPAPGYVAVHNSDYRNYRDDFLKGNNFNLYSEVAILDKHLEFEMTI